MTTKKTPAKLAAKRPPASKPVAKHEPAAPREHTVKPGDTLASVARAAASSSRAIAAANADRYPSLGWSPILQVGWRLRLA